MATILHKIWYNPKTGFTSAKVLFERAQVIDKKITKNDVDLWLAKQRTAQVHKASRKGKKSGHVTAANVNDRWQGDLVDMQNYPGVRKRLKMHWILVVVDVFSRKLYARAMQTKEVKNVVSAFNSIVEEAGEVPDSLDTDQGGEFGKTFDANVDDFYHNKAKIGDHRALGVVDATIRVFKNLIFKYITATSPSGTGTYDWASDLDELVENFNNTPKSALLGFTPNEVEDDEVKRGLVGSLNLKKHQETREVQADKPPYEIGEKVRVPAQKGPFKRGFKKQLTDKTYPIVKVNGLSVEVDVDGTMKRYLFSEIGDTGVALDKDTFEVEEVLDDTRLITRGKKKNIKQFLVKFVDEKELQWVDESDLIV
jgi:hypothetical protein